ncbi:LOW QUALITY PROTEIN: probable pleckstrin homology domain-containing family N member 1 [Alosa alosa]|uniref:LOW QUALITY PROTEIN: probable pleckstrin homology domain-containing family N member 1 n=1 Tax=Alosa alosa TaxID=278164 RepID=UPI0020152B7B|nr:LOW QUALITY PROTEIN: probable pleckstrin homology domain-containing family N member 1 [Alosa alosa]
MGTSMSCVPQHNFRFSSKSFIRRNSSKLFRKKNPEVGQEKSNSIINILCTVTPRKEMSPKDLQTIDNIKWDPPFPYDPASGWKKSSINVKNYGRMIHSSRVRFRFLHCQDVHDCFLDLFQTHLHFVSNSGSGLTYQGTLPLKELTLRKVQSHSSYNEPQEFAFQINGVSLNPIIVYCANQKEMDNWFGLLKNQIEANGGTAITTETYSDFKTQTEEDYGEGREELRNSISNEPIYEWEGSQRESLGPIVYVTKVKIQHLPCQDKSDRLLVMYPDTLIFLSGENNRLFYKGKLSLNMITVTTPCQEVKPNTFMIEGKLINPIIVSCPDKTEFHDWIEHFKSADVPILSPPPPVYDIIYTPTQREAPDFDRWSNTSHSRGPTEALRLSHSGRGSHELPFPSGEDNPLSPGYTEPLCYSSSRPPSGETQYSARLGSRSNSVVASRRGPSGPFFAILSCYSLRSRSSYLSSEVPPSPVYNMPYTSVTRNGPIQRVEKAPLIKSNSWSTPQSSIKFHHQPSYPQRHSDMCGPLRKPLSPLYDDPTTPGGYPPQGSHVNPAQSSWHSSSEKQCPPMLPANFRLRTPPMGRRTRGSLAPEQDAGVSQWGSEQHVEAVSRLKMLPVPNTVPEHSSLTQRTFTSCATMETQQISYGYSPDENCYLEPAEPDDQELDYDNIWEYNCHNVMIQPRSGILPHRTVMDFGAPGLSTAMATQAARWS